MFVDRSVPRISREYERFAFAREMKDHLIAQVQRVHRRRASSTPICSPMSRCRLLTIGMLGVAVMRLSDRLGPSENADELARDVLEHHDRRTAVRRPSSIALLHDMSGRRTRRRRARTRESSYRSRVMNRRVVSGVLAFTLAGAAVLVRLQHGHGQVSRSAGRPTARRSRPPPVAAIEQPIARFIRATGTLMAEEQADVAAEIAGRVVATPVERGTAVAPGRRADSLVADRDRMRRPARRKPTPRRSKRGSGSSPASAFDVNAVPEVQNAKAAFELAQNEFNRIQSLLDQRVVSQSEFDQRRTQMEAARQQYESAKNGAAQQYQALQAARARVALARKGRRPTRSSARRLPGWSPSGSSRSATTSPRASRSPSSCASIRCACS